MKFFLFYYYFHIFAKKKKKTVCAISLPETKAANGHPSIRLRSVELRQPMPEILTGKIQFDANEPAQVMYDFSVHKWRADVDLLRACWEVGVVGLVSQRNMHYVHVSLSVFFLFFLQKFDSGTLGLGTTECLQCYAKEGVEERRSACLSASVLGYLYIYRIYWAFRVKLSNWVGKWGQNLVNISCLFIGANSRVSFDS